MNQRHQKVSQRGQDRGDKREMGRYSTRKRGGVLGEAPPVATEWRQEGREGNGHSGGNWSLGGLDRRNNETTSLFKTPGGEFTIQRVMETEGLIPGEAKTMWVKVAKTASRPTQEKARGKK